MKRIIFLCIICVSYLHANNVYEDNFIRVEIENEQFRIDDKNHLIVTDNKDYYLHLNYTFYINDEISNTTIIYFIQDSKTLEKFQEVINNKVIKYDPTPFGAGYIVKYANDNGFTIINDYTKRYAQDWGTEFARDICIYLVEQSNNPDVLIEFFNIWPQQKEVPFILDNIDIDIMIENKNPIVNKYILLDNLLKEKLTLKKF